MHLNLNTFKREEREGPVALGVSTKESKLTLQTNSDTKRTEGGLGIDSVIKPASLTSGSRPWAHSGRLV